MADVMQVDICKLLTLKQNILLLHKYKCVPLNLRLDVLTLQEFANIVQIRKNLSKLENIFLLLKTSYPKQPIHTITQSAFLEKSQMNPKFATKNPKFEN